MVTTEADLSTVESLDELLESIKTKAEELGIELNSVSDVDTSGVDDMESSLEGASEKSKEVDENMKNTSDSAEEAAGSVDTLSSALTAAAGAAGLEKMVETADNINNSWNRLQLTFAGTGVSMDQLKQKQSELTAATGQTGGTIRNYFNQMGIAGVTNVDLLSSSFQALSGKAYQTGQSVEQMSGKFQRMVMTGNASARMLTSLGITADDLAKAMGVSASEVSEAFKNMTPEERIQALTKAMGEGKEANEMYKNSFEGLKTQAEAALAGLVGAVGQAILPVIIPMMQALTTVINAVTAGFKALPAPVQGIIGAIGGAALAITTLVGVLGVLGNIITTVKTGIQALSGIMKIYEAITKVVAIANDLLAVSEWAVLAPYLLVAAAIIAVIAILWYLYNTNETVRNAIDGFVQAVIGLGEAIYGVLISAFQALQSAWEAVVSFFQQSGQLFLEILFVVLTGPIGIIWLLIANFMGMPNQIGGALQNALQRVISWGSSMVSNMWSAGSRAISGFINQIAQLPGRVYNELAKTLSRVISWGSQIVGKLGDIARQAWQAFIRGLGIGSPGYIQILTLKELEDTGDRIPRATQGIINNVGRAGDQVVDAWGNPSFGLGANNSALTGANGNVSYTFNLYGDIDNEERMEKFIEAVRRELSWNNNLAGRTV